MKVGDGSIKLTSEFTNSRNPKELMKYIYRSCYGITSQYLVTNKIKEMFAAQGKSRMVQEFQLEDDIENPKSNWNRRLINNIKSDYLIYQLMDYISGLTELNSKKALIIYLLNKGYHINFRNKIRLDENYAIDNPDVDQESFAKIREYNKLINKFIEYFLEWNESNLSREAYERFLSKINKFDKSYKVITDEDGNETSILEIAEDYSSKFNEFNSSVVRRKFEKFFDNREDLDEFMNAVSEYWEAIRFYFEPRQKDLYKLFYIAETTYRINLKSALALLQNTSAIDWSKEVL